MTLSMPSSPNFVTSSFGIETNTQKYESPLTKTVKRQLLAGSRWMLDVTLPSMNRAQFAPWQAFFMLCEGAYNAFYGFDPDAREARGSAAVVPGTPLVKGGSQTGCSVIIDGCPHSVVGYLLPGDYIEFGGELKMVTAIGSTNGSGEVTVSFKPAIRTSPVDNAVVTVSRAACAMIMSDDMQTNWHANANGIYEGVSFSAYEVF